MKNNQPLLMSNSQAQTFTKQFGIFVGLFNKLNGTQYSVKQALQVQPLLALFNTISQSAAVVNSQITPIAGISTKSKSYSLVNIPAVDSEVYYFLQKNPNTTRSEIALGTGLRLQTVCGAARRLLDNKFIFVTGTTEDTDSNREVETLGVL